MQEKALMFQSVPCSIFCCAEKKKKNRNHLSSQKQENSYINGSFAI